MRLTVDLTGFVNAELVSRDGIPGVFIPFEPNCNVKYDKGGRHAYASFALCQAFPNKPYSFVGIEVIPMQYADKYLADPRYAGKRCKMAWLWEGDSYQESGGVVSEADFERIVGGR